MAESRNSTLPRVYSSNLYDANLNSAPVVSLTCIEHKDRPPGALWTKWKQPWGSNADFWEVLIKNDGKAYRTSSSEPNFTLEGFDAGVNVQFFVRSVTKGIRGIWGRVCSCVV